MTQAKAGNTVQIHYTGTLNDGSVFDTSEGRAPLSFTLGAGEIIPGLDAAIDGMEVGEKKSVTIPSDEAYGDYQPEARQAVPRESIPDHIPLDPGTMLQMQTPDGRAVAVTVAEADEASVTLDANHPLAGKDLTFDVEVVRVDRLTSPTRCARCAPSVIAAGRPRWSCGSRPMGSQRRTGPRCRSAATRPMSRSAAVTGARRWASARQASGRRAPSPAASDTSGSGRAR
jgi:FKBP-type peptidyl-prolyl cis-trans isomerase 2